LHNTELQTSLDEQNQTPTARLVHLLHNAELLNGEIFYTLKEAQVLIESWRCHYNAVRPHGSLKYRPPAPETIIMPSWPPGSATLRRPPSLAEKPAMH
jgi:transposase InsO family protein